jgi:hypothetical protein
MRSRGTCFPLASAQKVSPSRKPSPEGTKCESPARSAGRARKTRASPAMDATWFAHVLPLRQMLPRMNCGYGMEPLRYPNALSS